jgi:glutaredoxin
MTKLTLYSKRDCCLCDDALEVIARMRAEGNALEVEVIDIEEDAELFARYRERVPVVLVDGEPRFELHVDEDELRRAIADLRPNGHRDLTGASQ